MIDTHLIFTIRYELIAKPTLLFLFSKEILKSFVNKKRIKGKCAKPDDSKQNLILKGILTMRFKKFSALLTSVVMGAAMVAGTCFSASAATEADVTTNVVTAGADGGFYYLKSDGTTWAVAPHGMYDGVIKSGEAYASAGATTKTTYDHLVFVNSSKNTVSMYLQSFTYNGFTGSITSLVNTDTEEDAIAKASNGLVTLDLDATYEMSVTMTSTYTGTHSSTMTVKFVV